MINLLCQIWTKLGQFWRAEVVAGWQRLMRLSVYRMVFGLIACGFCSLVLTFFIFQAYNRALDLSSFTWFFDDENNLVFVVSWLIIFLLDLSLLAIFDRAILSNLVLSILSVIWLFVNQVKMTSRQAPLLPEDFFLAGEAGQMASLIESMDWYFLIRNLLLVAVMAVSAYFIYSLITHYRRPSRRQRWGYGLVVALIGIGGLSNIYQQLKDPEIAKTHENVIHNAIIDCCQSANYYWNGPVVGFMTNIGKGSLKMPDGYSEQAIREIVQRYKNKTCLLGERTKPGQEPINLVFVLSESLTDPRLFQDYYPLKQDPTPFLHWLQQNQPSGWLATTEYGGGTANVEADLLTSLSATLNHNTTPFTSFLPKTQDFPSVVSNLKSVGFETSAIHDYYPQMYKRHLSYPNLGIDRFYSLDDFRHAKKIDRGHYDSDRSFFMTLLDHLKRSNRSKFINGVTMQNHAPYDNIYNLTTQWAEQGELNDDEYNRLENYLTGLNHSDQALREFYGAVQALDQKTLVVIYGDHLPGSNIFQKVAEADDALAHTTPIVTISNFDLRIDSIGEMSANYLVPRLFETLFWKSSAYYDMLNELYGIFPKLTNFHVDDLEKMQADQLYHDYALIQYDLYAGKRYAQKFGFFEIVD